MKIVADLHIHSHFSRATSKNLTFEYLTRWAQLKGLNVVATGDITHPGWLAEMREKLVSAEDGLYRLGDDFLRDVQATVPPACLAPVRFILSGEISNIYKRAGQTRKVHNVVFAPSLDVVARLQARLEKIGNIRSDGRPILGLDSRDLLETLLEVDPACQLIPAHIWTPWFSMLGSRSGFDSVDECFGDLTHHIFALETGLSSDPPMNWRVSQLDRYTLVSNSDAHSPEKLAREATLFDTELSYGALFAALRAGEPGTFGGTIEFFPEEGKYHLDGHRSCDIVWEPQITIAHGGLCPVCGKPVTIGVMHRVEELADRPPGGRPAIVHPYTSLIPLPEVIGQVLSVGPGSARVEREYMRLLGRLGPELFILREVDLGDIAAAGGEQLAQGIDRMRRGEVDAQAGYDGEYGVIHLFVTRGGGMHASGQGGLFGAEEDSPQGRRDRKDTPGMGKPEPGSEQMPADADAEKEKWRPASGPMDGSPDSEELDDSSESVDSSTQASFFDLQPSTFSPQPIVAQAQGPGITPAAALLRGLNDAQREAVRCVDRSLIISAGPGTGKTRTLTHRIAYLVLEHDVAPESILAITFTNKACEEMGERLSALLGSRSTEITVKTFHAFAAALLRAHGEQTGLDPLFAILTEDDRLLLLRTACPELSQAEAQAALLAISHAKNHLEDPPDGDPQKGGFGQIYRAYQAALAGSHALDFDDLIFQAVRLLERCEAVRIALHARYRWISVDEYQDVNAAQVRFLRLLSDGGANVCVIGDPDQAIYGFRGADRSYFLSFLSDYPDSVCLRLTENYRSTQTILDAALQVIANDVGGANVVGAGGPDSAGGRGGGLGAGRLPLRAAKIFAAYSEQEAGQGLPLLDVHEAPTDRAEAEYVVHQIEQMIGGTSHFSLDSGRLTGDASFQAHTFADFAVLYRLGAQSRLLIEAFERSGMPYQTIGQAPLTGYADVREVLAALWCAHRMTVQGAAAGHYARDAARGARHFDLEVTRLLVELGPRPSVVRLVERLPQVLGVGRDGAGAARMEQLVRLAGPFGDCLGDFLEAMALHKETDAYDPRADRVTLMTLHAAKGLEFPAVFIVGCEEGLLPYVRDRGGGSGVLGDRTGSPLLEEERRLFYVGITRAQQKLVLCHARRRMLFGQAMENPVSRFVDDIESALKMVQSAGAQRRSVREPEPRQLTLF